MGSRFLGGHLQYLVSFFLVIGAMLVTTSLWLILEHFAQREDESHFQQLAVEAEGLLETRLQAYKGLLQGAAGYLNASDYVRPDEWHEYTEAVAIKEKYPGIRYIGYIQKVLASDRTAYEEESKRAFSPHFKIRALGPDSYPQLFVVPM